MNEFLFQQQKQLHSRPTVHIMDCKLLKKSNKKYNTYSDYPQYQLSLT